MKTIFIFILTEAFRSGINRASIENGFHCRWVEWVEESHESEDSEGSPVAGRETGALGVDERHGRSRRLFGLWPRGRRTRLRRHAIDREPHFRRAQSPFRNSTANDRRRRRGLRNDHRP